MNQKKNKQAGFTLSEMMVVIAIIGVLLVVILPNAIEVLGSAKAQSCQAYVKTVETQAQLYLLDGKPSLTIANLKAGNYINSETCPDGSTLSVTPAGKVTATKIN